MKPNTLLSNFNSATLIGLMSCGLCSFVNAFDLPPVSQEFLVESTCNGTSIFAEPVNIFEEVLGASFIWKANPETSGDDLLYFSLSPSTTAPSNLSFSFTKDLSILTGNNTALSFDYTNGLGVITSWPGIPGPLVNLGNTDLYVNVIFATDDGVYAVDPLNPGVGNIGAGNVLMRVAFDQDQDSSNGIVGAYSHIFTLANQSEFDLDIQVGGVTTTVTNGCIEQVPEPSGALLLGLSSLFFGLSRRRTQ